jgi:DNA repair protein RecN (Recombination protein N)
MDELALTEGEYEKLEVDQRRLAQAQNTLALLHEAETSLEQLDAIRRAVVDLEQIADDHKILASARANLSDALGLLDDAAHDLRHYRDQVIVDPGALADADERLSSVLSLARKHRIEPTGVYQLTQTLADELNNINQDEETLIELVEQAEQLKASFLKIATKLSNARHKAAPKFAKEVSSYMTKLGIPAGKFDIGFEPAENNMGIDKVEFLVTTNPNFAAGPLQQIASGGEQTRISLSIQLVTAATSNLPCLILDEADVGVGGTTADMVGRILRDLGSHTQVICITHAPQVAALGNQHMLVAKHNDETAIAALDAGQRVDELARMLAGADITDKTTAYATALLKEATG